MRHRNAVPVVALMLAAVGGACGRDRAAVDTAAAPPATVAVAGTDTMAGGIATRSEAQSQFDRARQALAAKDAAGAATALRAAATFMRARADSATGDVKGLLAASTQELENLARDTEQGAVTAVGTLDRAFAHANRAEAMRHHGLAVAAWGQKQSVRAGEELTMALDHLERAAKDAGETFDAATTTTLARARTLAAELLQGATPAAGDVDASMTAVSTQITRVGARIDRHKE